MFAEDSARIVALHACGPPDGARVKCTVLIQTRQTAWACALMKFSLKQHFVEHHLLLRSHCLRRLLVEAAVSRLHARCCSLSRSAMILAEEVDLLTPVAIDWHEKLSGMGFRSKQHGSVLAAQALHTRLTSTSCGTPTTWLPHLRCLCALRCSSATFFMETYSYEPTARYKNEFLLKTPKEHAEDHVTMCLRMDICLDVAHTLNIATT